MLPQVRGERMRLEVPRFWLAFWRVGFGVIWLADAWLKWQPAFIDHFVSYLTGGLSTSTPAWVHAWIRFWIVVVRVDPHLFAYLVAAGESVLGVALVLGIGVRLVAVVGSALSLIIWSTGEAFGGFYAVGATDIGTAIIYVGGFALLALTQAGYAAGLDGRLRLNGWSWRQADGDATGAAPPSGPAG